MAFVNISTADVAVDKPITSEWADNMIANDKFLNGQLANIGYFNINNGSFEVLDTAVVGGAANWGVTLFTGGAATITTASQGDGNNAMQFIHPGGAGNGAGRADSDFFPIDPRKSYSVNVAIRTDIAAGVYYSEYTDDQVAIGTTNVVILPPSGTTFRTYRGLIQAASSNARWIKITILAGSTLTAVPGTAVFDNISIEPYTFFSPGTYVGYNISASTIIAQGAPAAVAGSTIALGEDGVLEYIVRLSNTAHLTSTAVVSVDFYRNGSKISSASTNTSGATFLLASSQMTGRVGDKFSFNLGSSGSSSRYLGFQIGNSAPRQISAASTAVSIIP